jgi:hypothetical protein
MLNRWCSAAHSAGSSQHRTSPVAVRFPTRPLAPSQPHPRQGAFLLSFAMDDHHMLILSILVGMAAAGIVLGTFLVHAHG